jgi:protein O-GlcNAc transferase
VARQSTLQDAVNELMMLHAMGRFTDMEQRARVFLKSFSGAPVLFEFLGMALAGQHRYNDALNYFQRAARSAPDDAQFWENLASCQVQIGDFAEAERSFKRALTLEPKSITALATLAGVLHTLNRDDEAQIVAERAVAVSPRDPASNYQLGNVLLAKAEYDRAEHHLRLALAAGPNVAAVQNVLGTLLIQKREFYEAEACLRRAIDLNPGDPMGYVNLALVFLATDRRIAAADAARIALETRATAPPLPPAADVHLLHLIASMLDGAGHSAEAVNIYKGPLQVPLNPIQALAANYAARQVCDWDFAATLEPAACRAADVGADTTVPLRLLSLPSATPALQLAAARRAAETVLRIPLPVLQHGARGPGRTRLRVGYFSGDFFEHATAHLISGVIEAHDRAGFEILAYDFSPPVEDEYRSRLLRAFDRLVPIGHMSNNAAAQRIADDAVDILVDVSGLTKRSRPAVLAPRPAALQVAWLAYPGTLGSPWIDYAIADDVVAPTSGAQYFSEKIIRLPDTYQPCDDKRPVAQARTRGDYGLPEDAFVFCCFNQIFKLTPEVFEVWLRLLEGVDRSVLWLLEPQQAAATVLRDRLALRGLDPGRLIFAPTAPPAEHRARVAVADLALDCHPYGSHTTASDMLWAGVPLVALSGDTFASRVSASVLTAAGLPELITRSLDEYEQLALRLAMDRAQLAELKGRLQAHRATAALFDTARFTRNLERALTAIWERHAGGLPPDHVSIGAAAV